jgi:6-phosphogluconolactonase (cycloisomerase 2 family)
VNLVYVGSYTSGISVFARDGATLSLLDRVDTPNPSWLTLSPDRRYLYTVDELDSAAVYAFEVTDAGPRLLSLAPTGGEAPCHLLLHPAGYLLAANYGSGSVSVHVLGDDGVVGPRVELVQHDGPQPHAHQVRLAGDLVVVTDLGLDKLIGYRLDPATGELSVAADPFARTQPGAGPRHAVEHPNGRWYVANELDSTVAVFDPDRTTGVLRQVAAIPSTVDTAGNHPAEILLSPDGRWLYLSNRGRDTIATFAIDGHGDLSLIDEVPTGGSWPRHFAIVDDVMFVANERSDSVVSFAIDPTTGLPRPTGDVVTVGTPTCVLPALPPENPRPPSDSEAPR